MYQHSTTTQTDSTIRIFSPVILFHDATAECISDHQVIQLKKRKVNAMLKTNGQFWSNVIWSTRHQFSPPQTPPPSCSSNSSIISSIDQHTQQQHHSKRWYHTPESDCSSSDSSSSNSSIHDEEDEEDEEDEILEVVAIIDPPTEKKLKKTTITTTNDVRKRRGNLPKSVTAILRQWLVDHCKHPYPTEEEKRTLRIETNLTLNQISNWFINARRRILPLILSNPMKEDEKKITSKRKRTTFED